MLSNSFRRDLRMYHGTSLIIKQSTISDELRKKLCNHPFFQTPIYNLDHQDTFIKNSPASEYDLAVLEFLNDEGYDHSGKYVEYWFQKYDNTHTLGLFPHCDYNDAYRSKMKDQAPDWPHKVDANLIISPITIVVYLEVSSNMEGGELNISYRTWYEEPYPTALNINITQYPFEKISPVQGSVIYFKGSENYHWVNPVIKGHRKSLIINFWPPEIDKVKNASFESLID